MFPKKFSAHLYDFELGSPKEGKETPVRVYVYLEGIIIECWKMKTCGDTVKIRKSYKSFDYNDLIIVNDAINRIFRSID